MEELSLLRMLTLATGFVGVALGTYYVATLEALPPRLKGMRGLARARARHNYVLFRALDPLVRWTASRVHGFVSASSLRSLDRTLARAGDPWGLEPGELVALCVLGTLVGVAGGGVYAWSTSRSSMYPVMCGVLCGLYPWVRVDSLMQERGHVVRRGLPAAIDLLCLALSAGLDFPASIRQLVEKSGQKSAALIQELSIVLQELSLGKTRREALLAFSERNPGESVLEFVSAAIQAEEEGQPLGDVLRLQANVSRERRTVHAEEASTRAGLQLLMPMGLMFVAVLGLIGGPLVLRLLEEFGRG
jgi:tight adherence protein C